MSSADKSKILIVDDLEINRLVLEEIIESMGCIPVLASSAKEALNIIKESCPQLILTDISMPEIDGYEFCRILKKRENTKNIPIIFISAFGNPEDIIEGFRLGGEDYITKPFISEIVQARVGVHLRLHEVKQELMGMNRRLHVSVGEQLKQIENEKRNILYSIANIAAKVSGYNSAYNERVSENCRILAQGMQLSPLYESKISDDFIDTVELAAPLCNIGNVAIPRDILNKESDLTSEETKILQNHTNIGAEFLSDLCTGNDYNDFMSISIDIVRHHHENWDGSGYPDGLKHNEIPLAAQIVSVMEVYCAITNDGGHSREEAIEIMSADSGIKYNPDIFDICSKILRQFC